MIQPDYNLPNKHLHGVITAQDLEALRERNAQRVAEAIRALGTKWILHPDHSPSKK